MPFIRYMLVGCFAGAWLATPACGAEPFRLRDGDRVVLVGNTLIEREQQYGYWETALTRRFPKTNVIFRNLGWSGDTVFGDARAGFDTPVEGFRRLVERVLAEKPTVILVAYGANESFAGPAGLPHFVEGLRKLLDALAPSQARMTLFAPPRQEDLGRPLPDPQRHNQDLRLYGDAIREVAQQRGLGYVNLFELIADGARATPPAPLTDNGIHYTAYGYWNSARALETGLGLPAEQWLVELRSAAQPPLVTGGQLKHAEEAPLTLEILDDLLPSPPPPGKTPATNGSVGRRIRNLLLPPGTYALKIDGQTVGTGTQRQWAEGVAITSGPSFDQVEHLRQAIIAKNRLFFHRWRPQNETYLFGFRKHEQGQNAREIPDLDPLIAQKETEIARLRQPIAHRYEWVLQGKAN